MHTTASYSIQNATTGFTASAFPYRHRVSPKKEASEGPEPDEAKVACPVLRGLAPSNAGRLLSPLLRGPGLSNGVRLLDPRAECAAVSKAPRADRAPKSKLIASL